MSDKSIRFYLVFLLLLIPVILSACGGSDSSSGSSIRTCTIDHPIEDSAQLFHDPENNPDSVSMIPNGTECTYEGSFKYVEAGVEIPMYKLTCKTETGYMNRKWADCD